MSDQSGPLNEEAEHLKKIQAQDDELADREIDIVTLEGKLSRSEDRKEIAEGTMRTLEFRMQRLDAECTDLRNRIAADQTYPSWVIVTVTFGLGFAAVWMRL